MKKINKKASYFSILLLIFLLIILIMAYFDLTKKEDAFDRKIGERQYELLDLYQEGEKALYYIDQSAKYSAEKTIYHLGLEGMELSSECGDYYGYKVWVDLEGDTAKQCYPEINQIESDFEEVFNRNLKQYTLNYGDVEIPINDYEVKLSGNLDIIGMAVNNIDITLGDIENTIEE